MPTLTSCDRARDDAGVALPVALLCLVSLLTLTLGLAALSVTEPRIATNQLLTSQARSMADSGMELALWALSNALASDASDSMPSGPPYDGRTFLPLGRLGGVVVSVRGGASPHERTVTSVGWIPTNDPADLRTKAHRQIVAVATRIPDMSAAPCAVCVRGELSVGDRVTVDASATECGRKHPTYSGGETRGATGGVDRQPTGSFDGFTLSAANLDRLRAIARASSTYYGPDASYAAIGQPPWSGRVAFDREARLRNGVVFIDSPSGRPPAGAPRPPAREDLADVTISDGAFDHGSFTGWIIVNGRLDITGGMHIAGLVYALDAFTYTATGSGRINGLVVTQNLTETAPSSITSTGPDPVIVLDCARARGDRVVPHTWTVVPGSYAEVQD